MATYNFSSLLGTTVSNFAVATDTLAILNTGTEVQLADSASGLAVTTAAGTVTLAGVTLAQVTSTNITINGGSVLVGDNTTNSVFDIAGNTISAAGASSNLVYGLGGGDAITVGDGSNVVFGGTGATDTTDGGDTITLGTGSNTVYANAGDDAVSFTTTMLAGKTNTIYLGLGNDTINTPGVGTSTSSLVIYGGSGNDSFAGGTFVGDVTIFGGVGATDSTDGADTVTFGTGGITASMNAGNDTVTGGATISGKTGSYNLGVGDDTFTTNAAATAGTQTVFGASGTDNISLNATTTATYDATVYGGTGTTDTTDGTDTIVAGQTGAATAGFGGNITVYANAGNDLVSVAAVATKTATVYAGIGNDTVTLFNKAAVGTTVGSYLLTLGTGNDTVNSNFTGAPSDVVITDFESTDVINTTLSAGTATALSVTGNGSAIVIFNNNAADGVYTAGTDERITLTTTANLSATNFVLSDGSKVITNFSSTASTLTSTAAVDYIISGSAADTFVGSAGNNDKFEGNGGNDVFSYTTALLNAIAAGSTINGGDGTSDSITQSDAGNVTLNIATALSNVTNVERITLASGSHAITTGAITNARPAYINADSQAGVTTLSVDASAATVAITVDADGGTSTGAVTVTLAGGNNTVLTAGGADVITLGTGNDSVVAGTGDDTFNTATANWTSSDTLAGGVGTNDRIVLTNAATIVDTNFTNVTGVEQVVLTGAAQTVTLGTFATAAGLTSLNGSATTGVNTVDASAMTSGILITGGTAADSLTGGTGADTLYGGAGSTVDTLVGGSGVDNYAFTANGTANAVDIITSSNFVAGSGGDIFNFKLNASTFTNLVTEGIVTSATATTVVAGLATAAGALVLTTDAVGNAAALKTVLDAGDIDTATFGSRIAVWEIDSSTVGVAVITNTDNGATTNDTVVTQVASITGFANQAAVDAFTTGLTSANFDFI